MLGMGIASTETRSVSDDNLLRAARSGDMEAFGVLYERYKNPVYSFVARSVSRREDAEDITSETFCRAWSALASFRGESKLLSWLISIAVNLCRDLARKAPRIPGAMTEIDFDAELLSDTDPGPESRSVAKSELTEALRALPATHRHLVVLCDIEGYTAKEAAWIVGCTAISARVRLFRARRKLRELLAHLVEVD